MASYINPVQSLQSQRFSKLTEKYLQHFPQSDLFQKFSKFNDRYTNYYVEQDLS